MYQHLDIHGQTLPYAVGKVVCVGRSYQEHAAELNNPIPSQPLLFIKPATSLVGFSEPLVLPQGQGAIHHEVEVALLIGQRVSKASVSEALLAVKGVGLALDLTLRELQDMLKTKGHPWERAKAFDGSCPMSPFVPIDDISDVQQLDFSLHLNGQLRQQGNTRDLMWPMAALLAEISQCFTLEPGDVVLTGTPKGVGELNAQDTLELQLDNQHHFSATVC